MESVVLQTFKLFVKVILVIQDKGMLKRIAVAESAQQERDVAKMAKVLLTGVDQYVQTLRSLALTSTDFSQDAVQLAKYLLGKILVRVLDSGEVLRGRIVETEAYPGLTDVASHSFRGKTERNRAMFMPAGTCYVYYIYGRQNCVNVSSGDEAGAVLFRALEPIEGQQTMLENRKKKIGDDSILKLATVRDVSNGPAKLCQAMNITKDLFNCQSFVPGNENKQDDLFIIRSSEEILQQESMVVSSRVGIDGCGKEAAAMPFRFYIRDNFFVSVVKKTDKL